MAPDTPIPDTIATEVRRIFAETLRLRIEDVGLDARLDQPHLGIDSLALIKLNVALEEAFDIALPDFTTPEASTVRSVRDVAALVSARVASTTNGGAR
ncbi:acyl carrier protein [Polyangium aurulentum]|uniref:acyl carrier protein n=1 Tax=Polyangium aurulentum TaxID=2567896 RepID=UPI0010ADBA04|nr:acyl carrier protein [Polyangium aurulentum]UQA58980.1 acyl carrier protein [Polyangium aurulentum]